MSGDFSLKLAVQKDVFPANQTYRVQAHLGSMVLIFSTNPFKKIALSGLGQKSHIKRIRAGLAVSLELHSPSVFGSGME